MRADRAGWPRWTGALVSLGLLLTMSPACAADTAQLAAGVDVDRPSAPSMDLVRFENVAADVGLDFRHGAFRFGTDPDPAAMMGGGLCWIDYDRDGWLDLFVTNTWSNGEWGKWRKAGALPSSHLFRNEAGMFVDVTDETSTGLETRGHGCVAADLDLDGWTDLYVTTDRENVLLWNDEGNGFLDDAGDSSADVYGWHAGAAVGDIDANGWPDIFVAGYVDINRKTSDTGKGFPNTNVAEPDVLLLNDGPSGDNRATFRDVAATVGIEPSGAQYGLGAVLSDLDRDGDLDLYVANDTQPNELYENVPDAGAPGFRLLERGSEAGVDDDGAGMGVAVGDGNLDGSPDLVVTNQLKERHGAWWNSMGDAGLSFEDARPSMGQPDLGLGSTGWGTMWGDVDLDTDLDLLFVHGAIPVRDLEADRQLVQLLESGLAGDVSAGSFTDASAVVGLDAVGRILARGAAAADYDNDGDVDVAIGTIGGQLVLLRNTGAGGHWLEVAMPAPVPGAVVTVSLADGTVLEREVFTGSSYLSSEDPRAHFGLGVAGKVASVRVRWPDGSSSERTDVDADQILHFDPDDAE